MTKGTKIVRDCRKRIVSYTREQRRELFARAKDIISPEQNDNRPDCSICGYNDSMVMHQDGKWYCHRTHRID